MSTVLEHKRIKGENGLEVKVVLTENILTDDTPEEPSRTYDVETYFYKGEKVAPVLSVTDASAISYNEASKVYHMICSGMSVLENSEVQ